MTQIPEKTLPDRLVDTADKILKLLPYMVGLSIEMPGVLEAAFRQGHITEDEFLKMMQKRIAK